MPTPPPPAISRRRFLVGGALAVGAVGLVAFLANSNNGATAVVPPSPSSAGSPTPLPSVGPSAVPDRRPRRRTRSLPDRSSSRTGPPTSTRPPKPTRRRACSRRARPRRSTTSRRSTASRSTTRRRSSDERGLLRRRSSRPLVARPPDRLGPDRADRLDGRQDHQPRAGPSRSIKAQRAELRREPARALQEPCPGTRTTTTTTRGSPG